MDEKWIEYHEEKIREGKAIKIMAAMEAIKSHLDITPRITAPKIISLVCEATGLRAIPVAYALQMMLHRNVIKRAGKGVKGSPYRYYF